MSIEQEVELLNKALQNVLNSLEDATEKANQLLDYPLEEQPSQIQQVLDDAHDGLNNLQISLSHIDTLYSLIGTNLFFVNAIQLGFPTQTASALANIPGDAYINRHEITEQTPLKGTSVLEDPEAARRRLSNIWTTTALGDQGELSTWKALLDSGIPLEDITIKPNGLVNQYGRPIKPDFYCETEHLICDAKAWKDIHSLSKLQATVDKYAAYFQDYGEVRLYFPKDLCQAHGETLNRLAFSHPSVKVTIVPLPQTHQELERQREFFYHYLKSGWN